MGEAKRRRFLESTEQDLEAWQRRVADLNYKKNEEAIISFSDRVTYSECPADLKILIEAADAHLPASMPKAADAEWHYVFDVQVGAISFEGAAWVQVDSEGEIRSIGMRVPDHPACYRGSRAQVTAAFNGLKSRIDARLRQRIGIEKALRL